jgi:hypothetical protein
MTLFSYLPVSAGIHRLRAEDIMNCHGLQGTHLESVVLAHMQMGLYTPVHQANQQEAETFRASP